MTTNSRQLRTGLAAITFGVVSTLGLTACGDDSADRADKAPETTTTNEFCTDLEAANDRIDELFAASEKGGPTAEQAVTELIALAKSLADKAPENLHADFETLATAFQSFKTEYAAVDYKRSGIGKDPSFVSDPAFGEASSHVEAYGVKECGFAADN